MIVTDVLLSAQKTLKRVKYTKTLLNNTFPFSTQSALKCQLTVNI